MLLTDGAVFCCPPSDLQSPPPPGGGGDEQAEGGLSDRLVVQELWFIVTMAAVALLLMAVLLGVMLHRVGDHLFLLQLIKNLMFYCDLLLLLLFLWYGNCLRSR